MNFPEDKSYIDRLSISFFLILFIIIQVSFSVLVFKANNNIRKLKKEDLEFINTIPSYFLQEKYDD
jgi:hypothetical protein